MPALPFVSAALPFVSSPSSPPSPVVPRAGPGGSVRLDTPLLAAVLAAHDFEPMLSNPWRSDGSSPWPSPSPTAVWNDASLDPTNDRGDAADMGLSAALPVWAAATRRRARGIRDGLSCKACDFSLLGDTSRLTTDSFACQHTHTRARTHIQPQHVGAAIQPHCIYEHTSLLPVSPLAVSSTGLDTALRTVSLACESALSPCAPVASTLRTALAASPLGSTAVRITISNRWTSHHGTPRNTHTPQQDKALVSTVTNMHSSRAHRSLPPTAHLAPDLGGSALLATTLQRRELAFAPVWDARIRVLFATRTAALRS